MASSTPADKSASGTGVVWNIVSGDTFEVCVDRGTNGKPVLKRVTLAGVNVPRLKTTAATTEEPLAWEAREYLRQTLLSKKVMFRTLYEAAGRCFCEVRTPEDKTHLGIHILAQGFGRVAPGNQVKGLPFYNELEQAESSAASAHKGVHSATPAAVREVVSASDPEFDADAFLTENRYKLRSCIVEYIRDANCYRLTIVPEEGSADQRYVSLQVLLSGVQSPTFVYKSGVEEEASPNNGAFFARAFALERLLCRKMSVRIESMERKPGSQVVNWIASLVHPAKGSIAEFFLEGGFGQYVDWSAQKSLSGPEVLRNAQKRAQDAKLRRWKTWSGEGSDSTMQSFEFSGKVTEVCSGDVLRIIDVNAPDRNEKRYYLASVRAPAVKTEAGWAAVALEFMRKKCIGKTVQVRVEYKKNISVFAAAGGAHPPPSDEKTGDLLFVSISDPATKANLVLDAIREGLLAVQQARTAIDGSSERARDYDEMVAAESEALEAKRGRHTGGEPPRQEVFAELVLQTGEAAKLAKPRGPVSRNELTERARAFEPELVAKKGGHEALVTFIMNGSRLRLKLVHEKLIINFQMEGVRAPNAERSLPSQQQGAARQGGNVPRAEPFGTESLQFMRELCMQQEVRAVIKRVDPAGTFCGQLFFVKGGRRGEDLAMALLERGFAYCDGWSSNSAYLAAEAKAKRDKLAYWSAVEHEVQVAADQAGGDAAQQTKAGTPIKGEITHIESVDEFYLVPTGSATTKIQNEIMAEQSKFEKVAPVKRQLCLAQHWEDQKWYRARLEGRAQSGEGQWNMFFVDFGMRVDVNNCKRIPPGHPLGSQAPAALKCGLYGIKTNDEWWESACTSFFKKIDGKTVSGTMELTTADGVRKCVLSVAGSSTSVNTSLLKEGFCRMARKENDPSNAECATAWKEAQTTAKRAHINIWRYGDVGSDDEDY